MQSIQSTGAGKGAASLNAPKARRINDACRALGIGRTTIYKLRAENKIKFIYILGCARVPESEIERLASEGVE